MQTGILARTTDEDVYRLILQSLEDGVYLVDMDRRITYWNEGAERITGYLSHDVIGRHCGDALLLHSGENGVPLCGAACPLTATMVDGRPRHLDTFLRHQRGHRVPVSIRSAPVRDGGGTIIGAVEIFHVDSRHYGLLQKFRGLEPFGCLDPDTGVANREMTLVRLRHRLEDLQVFGIPVGLFMVEIEGRDRVRARGGHAAWLSLIAAAARTMAETIPPNGFLGRWEEHRFLGLLGNSDPMTLHELTARLAGLVQATDVVWWGDALRTTVSIRSAMAEPGESPESAVARVAESVVGSR